jgi:hypothetical protein
MPSRSGRLGAKTQPAARWRKHLTRNVETTDGEIFTTLSDAGRYVSKQPERNEWLNAAAKLMAAAKSGNPRDIGEATDALENALFVDGMRLKIFK